MRYLLGGAAIAALLAAGLPAAAQNNETSPANPPSAATDQNQNSATPNEPGTKHRKHSGKHAAQHRSKNMAGRHHASPGDNIAEQLNREELQRVQQNGGKMPGSGSSMTPGAGTMPENSGGGMQQPSNGTPQQ
jgi:hypothetical protein